MRPPSYSSDFNRGTSDSQMCWSMRSCCGPRKTSMGSRAHPIMPASSTASKLRCGPENRYICFWPIAVSCRSSSLRMRFPKVTLVQIRSRMLWSTCGLETVDCVVRARFGGGAGVAMDELEAEGKRSADYEAGDESEATRFERRGRSGRCRDDAGFGYAFEKL